MKHKQEEKPEPFHYKVTVIIFLIVVSWVALGLLAYGLKQWLNP